MLFRSWYEKDHPIFDRRGIQCHEKGITYKITFTTYNKHHRKFGFEVFTNPYLESTDNKFYSRIYSEKRTNFDNFPMLFHQYYV